MKLDYVCPALNVIPVHSSRDSGFIDLFPVAGLTDSLKISFGYQWVLGISRVKIYSSYPLNLLCRYAVEYQLFLSEAYFTEIFGVVSQILLGADLLPIIIYQEKKRVTS